MAHRSTGIFSALSVATALAGMFCFSSPGFAGAFLAGDIVVSRVGDGGTTLGTTASAVFLDEYTTTGTFVQTISMPTTAGGGNQAYANTGNSAAEGHVQLSPDGTTLSMIGYAVTPGSSVSSTVASTTHRVIATIKADGVVNASTVIDTGTTGIVRGVITDGTKAWFGTNTTGTEYVPLGQTTGGATQLSTTVTGTRDVVVFNGQLYTSSAAGTTFGVISIGSGEPTTSGQSETLLPGFPTSSGSSYDFFFADATDLYVADDRTTAGGLQKWVFAAGTWTNQYTLNPGSVGFRSVTGVNVGGNVTMFATGTDNNVYSISDILSDTTVSGAHMQSIVAGVANAALRGVEFVPVAAPEPASLGLLAIGGLLLLRRRR